MIELIVDRLVAWYVPCMALNACRAARCLVRGSTNPRYKKLVENPNLTNRLSNELTTLRKDVKNRKAERDRRNTEAGLAVRDWPKKVHTDYN